MESLATRRSTHALVAIIFLVLGILLTLGLVKSRQEIRQRAGAETTLEIVPQQKTVDQGAIFTVDVVLNTGNSQVTRADVTLFYDDKYLEGVSFKPEGTLLPQVEEVGLVQNGVANIVVGAPSTSPATGNGSIARLTFKARNPADTLIRFDGGSTHVKALGGDNDIPVSLTQGQVSVTRTIHPRSVLYVEPMQTTVKQGDEFVINVQLDTGTNSVTTADFKVLYNQSAAVLTGIELTPGDFLVNEIFRENFTDGGVSVRLAVGSPLSTNGKQGIGIVAKLKFRAETTGTTTISFDAASSVKNFGSDENMLSETRPGYVTVEESTSPGTGGPDPTPASACQKTAPFAPTGFSGTPGSSPRKIDLTWDASAGATHYGIVYGVKPGRYIYGAANVGNVTAYTVSNLSSNGAYYFAVFAVNDCAASGFSYEVAIRTASYPAGTPLASPVLEEDTEFVPLDPDEDALTTLTASPTPIATPLPTVSAAPQKTDKPGLNPLVTPLGGILLIIVALFVGIFFFRMRS